MGSIISNGNKNVMAKIEPEASVAIWRNEAKFASLVRYRLQAHEVEIPPEDARLAKERPGLLNYRVSCFFIHDEPPMTC